MKPGLLLSMSMLNEFGMLLTFPFINDSILETVHCPDQYMTEINARSCPRWPFHGCFIRKNEGNWLTLTNQVN